MTRVPHAFPVPATVPAGRVAPGALPPRRSPRVIGRALVALTKPRIIELLLVTTLPTMLLAQRGLPSVRLILVTLVGGTLAAGSANTINCYIDRDIDAVMKRTSRRPLVVNGHGTIKPWEALVWGIVLGAAATLLLGLLANWLAAALADAAILFYIFVYTLLLKRRSPANIVIGGAAGCFPVLVGWAAVTGTVGVPAVVLFAIIFLWTPPHFWALAMKFRKDYAAANVPMLPVVASPVTVARKILWYSYAMVAATLALIPYAGWIYGVFAAALGVWFLAEAHRLNARVTAVPAQAGPVAPQAGPVAPQAGPVAPQAAAGSSPAPMRLFHLSIAYLTLLFAAVAVTALLPWGRW
ncbi:MAG TPA: heme o synthase [Streptosporangiaceae bacterium]|nr:heme o synthase [Streptosporangiaceae bacterium]